MNKLSSLFILIALYTPLFWYISHLRTTYSSVDFLHLEFSEKIIYSFFIIMPILALAHMSKTLERLAIGLNQKPSTYSCNNLTVSVLSGEDQYRQKCRAFCKKNVKAPPLSSAADEDVMYLKNKICHLSSYQL